MPVAGTSSCNSSSRFPNTAAFRLVTPVILPPGRLRLVTRPNCTGSTPVPNTIGMVLVAAFAASDAGIATATKVSNHSRWHLFELDLG